MSVLGDGRIRTLPEDDLVEDEVADTSAFQIGAVLEGKYRLEREIARGGLGVVLLATHVELGQQVAIKYLKPQVLAKPVLVERFRREAQLCATIRSEHVVRVFDVGSVPNGGPYIVMELLEGEDLGTRLMRGALPIDEAVDYVIQACDAVAEAHALGIVHRDLKPENLFIVRRPKSTPVLKILDFGISKTYERKKKLEGAPVLRRMTEVGERFGTPLYMSPEQFLATGDVDARTDIWSLGVVLYELVSGTLPFEGETMTEYGSNVIREPITPLTKHLPSASVALEAIVTKCLEKKPEDRYRNVAELVMELVELVAPNSIRRTDRIRRVVTDGGESIRPPRPHLGLKPDCEVITAPPENPDVAIPERKSRRGLVIGALVTFVAVAVTLVLTLTLGRTPAPAPVAPARTEPEKTAEPPPPPPPPPPAAVEAAPAPPPKPSVSAAPRPVAAPRPKPRAQDYDEFGDRR